MLCIQEQSSRSASVPRHSIDSSNRLGEVKSELLRDEQFT